MDNEELSRLVEEFVDQEEAPVHINILFNSFTSHDNHITNTCTQHDSHVTNISNEQWKIT